ncbi:MAG TPA: flavin reductase family protein [Candidatus Sulfotelmatobacter sp.]|nr:flavin reductase family protein [Candidatus Sulfotelmatobacter sp.]
MFYQTDRPHGLRHNPFKSLVVPRPIGWVSTMSRAGTVNLAPFSFFNAVADTPPVVIVCCNGSHKEGGAKDTLANIAETGEFVVNIATWELREQMNRTSANVPRSVDEMQLAGLEPAPSRLVRPPRVAASPANLECVHLQTVELPSTDPANANRTIFGRVVGVHISEAIIADGMIDMTRFLPIARLGYNDYTVVREVFTMRRPD